MSEKLLYALARPLLFALDAETAHNLTLPALRRAAALGLTGAIRKPDPDPRTVMGITFPNPVGLAAGLDKDGAYIDGLAALGFGSIEVGTVTPRAQPGNPKPRMFRIPAKRGIINRMGFNNGGVDAFVANVQASRFYQNKEGVLGLNIGKNADTPIERAADDYLHCLEKVYPYASYVTVNISSPNTKNLRQLQDASELDTLLARLKEAQSRLADQHKKLRAADAQDRARHRCGPDPNIADALLRHKIDGVIATNTTTSRARRSSTNATARKRAACRARRCSSNRPSSCARSSANWATRSRSSASAASCAAPTPRPRWTRAPRWCSCTAA